LSHDPAGHSSSGFSNYHNLACGQGDITLADNFMFGDADKNHFSACHSFKNGARAFA